MHTNPAEFKYLTGLPALEIGLFFENDGITDEALGHIGKITTLKELDFGDGHIGAAGIKALAGLKGLVSLNLGWCDNIDDAAIAHLVTFVKLEKLNLSRCKATEAGLALLSKLPNLKELKINAYALTDAGLGALRACKALTTLEYSKKESKASPAALAAFRQGSPACTVTVR